MSSKTRNTVQDSYLLSDADEQLILNIAVRMLQFLLQSTDVLNAPHIVQPICARSIDSFDYVLLVCGAGAERD